MTAASWYSPYKTRTFLRTFRGHNQAARILMFVDPIQVAQRCATKPTPFAGKITRHGKLQR